MTISEIRARLSRVAWVLDEIYDDQGEADSLNEFISELAEELEDHGFPKGKDDDGGDE